MKAPLRVGPYGLEPHNDDALNRAIQFAIRSGAQEGLDRREGDRWVLDEKKTWAVAAMRIAWALEHGLGIAAAFTCCDWPGNSPRPNTAFVRSRAQGHPECVGYFTYWEQGDESWDSVPSRFLELLNDDWPSDLRCVCRITRRHHNGAESITERSFSVAMAKRQALWDTAPQNRYGKPNTSPWYRNPADMIRSRAEDRACWGAFADAIEAPAERLVEWVDPPQTVGQIQALATEAIQAAADSVVVDRSTGEIVGVDETPRPEGQQAGSVKQTAGNPETNATEPQPESSDSGASAEAAKEEPDDLGVSPVANCDCVDSDHGAAHERAGKYWGGDPPGYSCNVCAGWIPRSEFEQSLKVSEDSSSSQAATSKGGSGSS